uniref:Uncharacterized protein n=1 Tax=Malurus cyaneus samueli TaxID=2593467 RepID=A0A8C5TQ13_9PASS
MWMELRVSITDRSFQPRPLPHPWAPACPAGMLQSRRAWRRRIGSSPAQCLWLQSPVDQDQKSKAILVLLSLGCFTKVAEMLHRAALFVEACLKYGAFEVNDDTNILFLKSSFYADSSPRSLTLLGFKEGAVLFASKAGESGKDLLTELKQPKEEVVQE